MCNYDPTVVSNLPNCAYLEPVGMYPCPKCGEMVIAGLPHPAHDDDFDSKRAYQAHLGEDRVSDDDGSFDFVDADYQD